MAEYSQITDHRLQSRLLNRYKRDIDSLKAFGFHHLSYCLEDLGPYSALLQFPIIPLAILKKEVIRFRWPFRLASANIILSYPNPPSVALCMGMGIKFYSAFSDGKLLISSNFLSKAVPGAGSKVIRLPYHSSLEETWTLHKAEALRIGAEMSPLSKDITFNDYVTMSAIEENLSQYA